MGVHDIASYVKYHQQKLRDEQQQAQAQSMAASKPTPQRKKQGVNSIHSKKDFDEIVAQTVSAESTSPKILLLDAFATWCGPCKQIAPIIADMSNDQYKDTVGFYKFDVDNVPDLAQELGVRAMPTFFVFKDGELAEQIVGANPKAITATLDKLLAAE